MPLQKGSSRSVIQNNIREMMAAGHPQNQSVAAALHSARGHYLFGGQIGGLPQGGNGLSGGNMWAQNLSAPLSQNQAPQQQVAPPAQPQASATPPMPGAFPGWQQALPQMPTPQPTAARPIAPVTAPAMQQASIRSAPMTPAQYENAAVNPFGDVSRVRPRAEPNYNMPSNLDPLSSWWMGLAGHAPGGIGQTGDQAAPAQAPAPSLGTAPMAYQADGGRVKQAGLVNRPEDEGDRAEFVPVIPEGARAMPMPSYLTAIERMHENRKRAQGLGNSLGGFVDAPGSYAGGGGLPSAHHPYEARGAPHGVHLVNSSTPGRTDRIRTGARPGSYIVPAHLVSGLGQGNTQAGAKMWGDLLSQGPYGIKNPKMGGHSMMKPPATPSLPRAPSMKMASMKMPSMKMPRLKGLADGGAADEHTPIVLAGGELVVDPEVVASWGEGGDIEKGKQQLDKTMMLIHKQILDAQSKYPGPVT